MKAIVLNILAFVAALVQAQSWKDIKVIFTHQTPSFISELFSQHLRTNALKSQNPVLNVDRLNYFGNVKKDERHFAQMLQQILKVRTPNSEGSAQVRQVSSSKVA